MSWFTRFSLAALLSMCLLACSSDPFDGFSFSKKGQASLSTGQKNQTYFVPEIINNFVRVSLQDSTLLVAKFKEGIRTRHTLKIQPISLDGVKLTKARLQLPLEVRDMTWKYVPKSSELVFEWTPSHTFTKEDISRFIDVPVFLHIQGSNLPKVSVLQRNLRLQVEKTERPPEILYTHLKLNNRVFQPADKIKVFINPSKNLNQGMIFYLKDDNFRSLPGLDYISNVGRGYAYHNERLFFRSLDLLSRENITENIWRLNYQLDPSEIVLEKFKKEFHSFPISLYPFSSVIGAPISLKLYILPRVSNPTIEVSPFKDKVKVRGKTLSASVNVRTTYNIPINFLSSFKKMYESLWQDSKVDKIFNISQADPDYLEILWQILDLQTFVESSTECQDLDTEEFAFSNVSCDCDEVRIAENIVDKNRNFSLEKDCQYNFNYSTSTEGLRITLYQISVRNKLALKDQTFRNQQEEGIFTGEKPVEPRIFTQKEDFEKFVVENAELKPSSLSDLVSLNLHPFTENFEVNRGNYTDTSSSPEIPASIRKVGYARDDASMSMDFYFISDLGKPRFHCEKLTKDTSFQAIGSEMNASCDFKYDLKVPDDYVPFLDIDVPCSRNSKEDKADLSCVCYGVKKLDSSLMRTCFFNLDSFKREREFSISLRSRLASVFFLDEDNSEPYESKKFPLFLTKRSFKLKENP